MFARKNLFLLMYLMWSVSPTLYPTNLVELNVALVNLKSKLLNFTKTLNSFASQKSMIKSQSNDLQEALQKLYDSGIVTYGTMKNWQAEEELSIDGESLDITSLNYIQTILEANNKISQVNLSQYTINNKLLHELLIILSKKKKLTKLMLKDIGFSPENMSLIKSFINIEHLDLSNNNLKGADFSELASLKKLRNINFEGCKLTNEEIGSIAQQEGITDLNLSRNSFSEGFIKRLLPLKALTKLNLGDRALSRSDAESLASLDNLKTLGLSMCGLTDDKLQLLAKCSNIENLDLSYNDKITLNGVKELKALPKLERLSIYGCLKKKYPDKIGSFKHIGWGLYIPETEVGQQKTRTINYSQLSYKGTIPKIEWRNNWCFMDAVVTCLAFIEPLYDLINTVELPDINEIKTKLAVDLINKLKFLLTYLRTTNEKVAKAENGPMRDFYNAWIAWSGKPKGSTGDSSVLLKDLFAIIKLFQNGVQKEYFTTISEDRIGMPESEISNYKSFAVIIGLNKTEFPVELNYDSKSYRLVAKVFGSTGHATAMVINGKGKVFYYNHMAINFKEEVTMTDLASNSYDNKPTMICFYAREG